MTYKKIIIFIIINNFFNIITKLFNQKKNKNISLCPFSSRIFNDNHLLHILQYRQYYRPRHIRHHQPYLIE